MLLHYEDKYLSSIMVGKRLRKLDQNPFCCVIHFVCKITSGPNFAHSCIVLSIDPYRIKNVQLSIGHEIRMEFQTEETPFIASIGCDENVVGNVEERNVADATSVLMECVDNTHLLSDENSSGSVFRCAENKRVAQTGSEGFQTETTVTSDGFSHDVPVQNCVRQQFRIAIIHVTYFLVIAEVLF